MEVADFLAFSGSLVVGVLRTLHKVAIPAILLNVAIPLILLIAPLVTARKPPGSGMQQGFIAHLILTKV